MDSEYVPPEIETRQVYGVSLQQRRNDAVINGGLFGNVVSLKKEVCIVHSGMYYLAHSF